MKKKPTKPEEQDQVGTEETLEVTYVLTGEAKERFERIQRTLCISNEEAVEIALEEFIHQNDPVKKIKPAKHPKPTKYLH